MENELYLLSLNLRAVAHVLHYSDYILGVTSDADFPTALISVVSDYLYFVSDRTLEKLSETGFSTAFYRSAVFGRPFSDDGTEEVSSNA